MAETTAKRTDSAAKGFTKDEKDAMRERAKELKAEQRRAAKGGGVEPEAELLAKIAEMSPADRAMAERIHEVITTAVPSLSPRTWYGMPAYAKDGKILCHFQPADKFKTRYATLGFSDEARLDDGRLWPVAYAVTELTPADEARIVELVKQAAG